MQLNKEIKLRKLNRTEIKNTNTIKEVIIIKINNNMQVIWNSKLKFVSGSQLFRIALCSLFGSVSGPFTASGFIVLNLNPLIECL